ncbi:hypothetical protein LIER_11993 [Lithospermum erythrorhizon]|uniref:Uncharacterized protein n=1 Tax=Lithospermum erythrorhizon TaxID=34254 RepID=A0AAV3PV92_LITER
MDMIIEKTMERYGSSVCRTEAVRASLEDMQGERDFAVKDIDAAVRERDILRAGRDEMLQIHNRLLDQLIEGQCQSQVMEATFEGTRNTNGMEELV